MRSDFGYSRRATTSKRCRATIYALFPEPGAMMTRTQLLNVE